MNRFLASIAVSLMVVTTSLAAAAGNTDDDLRQAAKLHKWGDTAQAVAIRKTWADKGNVDAAYDLAMILKTAVDRLDSLLQPHEYRLFCLR